MMGSARALLVDAGTVAMVVVLLWEIGLALRLLRRERRSRTAWAALAAPLLGLLLVAIARGADLIDVLTLESADRYPTIGVPYAFVFLAISVGALAVTDSVMSRAGWLESRGSATMPRARRLWPALIMIGVVVGLAGLQKIEPVPTAVGGTVVGDATQTTVVATTTSAAALEARVDGVVTVPGRARITATGYAEGLPYEAPPSLTLTPLTASGAIAWPIVAVPVPGADEMYAASRTGLVVVIASDGSVSAPILDLTDSVDAVGDSGLLGLTLHPDFPADTRMYLSYHSQQAEDLVVEYQVEGDPAAPNAVVALRTLVRSPRDSLIHQGGAIRFGPDRLLYVAIGDAGRTVVAQDPTDLRGSIVRFDVDSPSLTMPIETAAGASGPDVWVFGVRNPHSFWIDAVTRLASIGDVGEASAEEIDIVSIDGSGYNLGWPILEGFACRSWSEPFFGFGGCDRTGFVEPVMAYSHFSGCAVLLGPVYRGVEMPEWEGWTFFADYCAHILRAYRLEGGAVVDTRWWAVEPADELALGSFLGFATDHDGEILLLTTDRIYRLGAAR